MKKSLRAIAIGTTIAAAFSAGVFAEDIYQTVSAYLIHDVTVSMDGVELSYINEDGSALPPLVYNDCIYLPVSYILSASDKVMTYNAETKNLDFSTPPPPPAPDPVMAYEIVDNDNWIITNSIGTKYMMGAVTVKNTGTTNLFLSSATFDIEDASGSLVDTSRYISAYPQVIAPGETAVYFNEMSFAKGTSNGESKIVPTVQAEESKVDLVRCPVTDVKFTDSHFGGVEVVGRVENTTAEEQNLLNVAVVLYDKDGNVLSVLNTYASTVAPGAKIGFSASSIYQRNLKASDIASYEAYAYPTQFNF